MIRTTIGLYPNGSFVVNGVPEQDLARHISYNQTFRPGRALLVDGQIVYSGSLSRPQIEQYIRQHDLTSITRQQDTAPYR